ncbi:MAG TPA: T6SS immunity protein Tdi1 domain-containing protein [Povalibacter sp.]|nr:T6SS immunity protein Tdi1 domain-containing protein [Povalibacter sp.]
MELAHYLLDQKGEDWSSLLRPWRWLLPASFTIWMVNRFGEVIMVVEDGSVHRLDIGAGTLERVAESREDFGARMDIDDNAGNWFMICLVDDCVAGNLHPGPGQCYAFRILPSLGGEYSLENVMVASIRDYYEFSAQVHEQLRGVPDGTSVEIR